MLGTAILFALTLVLAPQVVAQPLDLTPDCTVTVGNQTALVRPDGTFLVRNVTIFTSADTGILPQLYRARATCLREGQMLTGQSEFFVLDPGQTAFIADVLPTALDPIPTSITASASAPVVPRGEAVQLTVTAHFPDGTALDVTPRAAGTSYRSSNPRLVQVTGDGLLIGTSTQTIAQTALVGIMNEGNLAVVTVTATGPPGDVDNDGLPDEWETLFGFSLTSDDAGGDPDGDTLTNLEEFNLGTLPLAADTDLDRIPDNLDNEPLRPDETPPVVAVTSPEDGAVLIAGDTVLFAAEALDNEGLDTIELRVDGESVATGNSSPFIFQFTVSAGAESLAFEASATDLTGNVGTAAVSATVLVDPLTTVVGQVVDAAGVPVVGAAVILNSGDESTTDSAGDFSIPGVPSLRGDLFADAAATVGGEDLSGTSAVVAPVPGGVTDLGSIEVMLRGSIFPGRIFPTGDQPWEFALGDVNLDGHLDAVVPNSISADVAVLLGTGNGTFKPATRLPTSANPRAVELADLNDDGHLDMAVAHWSSGSTVSIRLGLGGGVFGSAQSYSVGTDPRIVKAVDVDGDDVLDLATLNLSSASIAVLSGTGDGTFQPAEIYPVTSPSTRRLLAADFNSDDVVDLVALSTADAISVLLGNGDGTFQAEARYAVGRQPFDLVVGDLDRDGDLDLVTPNLSSDDLSVLINDGSGAFPADMRVTAPERPGYTVIDDFNLDGVPDLATCSTTAQVLAVFLGTGDGGFAAPLEIMIDSKPGGRSLAGDLDRDGIPDLILGGGLILRGAGDGTFTVAQRPLLNLGVIADVDGDGSDDLVGLETTGGGLVVFLGNGDGTVEAASALPGGGDKVWPVIADFDLDGRFDLLAGDVRSHTVSVFEGLGDGRFGSQQEFPVGGSPVSEAVVDVNLDGIPDVITANTSSDDLAVLLGTGDGTFQAGIRIVTGLDPTEIVAADLDLDTLSDVVVTNRSSNTISVLLGDPAGGFRPAIDIANHRPTHLALGDLNGDTFLDMAVLGRLADDVDVFLGAGDGGFTLFQTFATGNTLDAVALADIDLDGNLDLVIGNRDNAEGLAVHPGRGDGTFEPRITYPVGRELLSVAVADINRDGLPDVLATSFATDDLTLLLGNGDRTFRPAQRFYLNTAATHIAVGDLNGDGKPDVAVPNRSGRAAILVLLQR